MMPTLEHVENNHMDYVQPDEPLPSFRSAAITILAGVALGICFAYIYGAAI